MSRFPSQKIVGGRALNVEVVLPLTSKDVRLLLVDSIERHLSRSSNGEHPLVSVLINNYNYGAFLAEAIDSALAQSYDKIEVIAVDDGSTDSSREIIAGYGDRIIPVLKENGGQASAFNAGFSASKGDIVCFLDADDVFQPEKVATLVDICEDDPTIGWCFDRAQKFDDKTGRRTSLEKCERAGRWDERATILATGMPPYIPTATSGLSFRRSVLARILPMPEFRHPADAYLKLAGIGLSEGWMDSRELTLQRIHENNWYTDKPIGKRSVMASTGLMVGVSLHEQIPALRLLATNIFSAGLGLYWIAGVSDSRDRQVANTFLQKMSLSTKGLILWKAVNMSVRTLVSDSLRACRSVFSSPNDLNPSTLQSIKK